MKNFSNWFSWKNRDNIDGLNRPGIYCLAVSSRALAGVSHSWIEEVSYIGMSNAAKGVKGRLSQFDKSIHGKTGHGGADRFRFEYRDSDWLADSLYVAVELWDFDPATLSYRSLRGKGDVAQRELHCIASYYRKFKKLPKFNDPIVSPKLTFDGRVIDRARSHKS